MSGSIQAPDQASTAGSNAAQRTRACVVCREDIRPGALKCTHCDSYQNWTRHLFRWSGVVAAAVALYPLWTMAMALQKIATPHRPELRFAALSCGADVLSVAVANVGTSDGVLSGVTFRVDGRSEIQDAQRTLVDRKSKIREGLVVKPDQVVIVDYVGLIDGREAAFPRRASAGEACAYKVTFSIVGLAPAGWRAGDRPAGSETSEVTCPCPS
jgi:hypothetical protein